MTLAARRPPPRHLTDRIRTALLACPILAPAGPVRLDALARDAWLRSLARDEALFRVGDPGDAVFVVVTGRIAARLGGEQGAAHDLDLAGPGALFGTPELLARTTRTCDAVAVEPSTVAVVPGGPALALLRGCPPVLLAVARDLAGTVAGHARSAERRSLRTATSRVAEWLAGAAVDGSVTLDEPQAVLARRLGISRQTLSRTLRELAGAGVLRVHPGGRVVSVVAPARLGALAG